VPTQSIAWKKEQKVENARDVVGKKTAAFNKHHLDEAIKCFSPEATMQTPIGPLSGRDQVSAFFSAFWTAFPDLKIDITREVAEGSTVIQQAVVMGTHLETLYMPGGAVPATGRKVAIPISDHFDVREGLIAEVALYFDRLALLEQLGAVPAGAVS
jgi:steroid delta-isomerase-like uncharacterized protein